MRKLFFSKQKRDKATVRNLDKLDIYFEEMEAPLSYKIRKLQNRQLRALKPKLAR